MKYQTILLIYLLGAQVSIIHAQTPDMEQLIKKAEISRGKEKIRTLAEISKQYYASNPKKGIEIGKMALHISDSLKITSEKSKIYNNIAANYFAVNQIDTSRFYFEKGLRAGMQYHDSLEMGIAYNGIGLFFEKSGNFDSALIVFHKALVINKLIHNEERIGRTLDNLGTIHQHKGEYKSSLTYLLQANNSYEKSGYTRSLPYLYLKLGWVYAETADFATAEKWYRKGKQLSLESKDFQTAGIAMNAIGIMYKNQGKYEEALKNYLEVIPIADKINNKKLLLAVYGNIGNVYQSKGIYDKALEYFQKSIQISNALNVPFETAKQQVNIGNTYNSLKDFKNSLINLEKALPVFTNSKSLNHLLSTYEAMIVANNGLKRFENSVVFYEKFIGLKDSLYKNELNTALDSLKVKFNTEQTIQENTLLAQKNEIQVTTISLQRNMIISTFVITVLLIGFILMIFRNRQKIRKANILLEEKNLEISEKAEALKQSNQRLTELSQFKDSMQSFLVHDLKNALNIIINSDLRSDPDEKLQGIRIAGKRMLNMVHNMLDITGFENNRMSLNTLDFSHKELVVYVCRQVKMQAATRNIMLSFKQDYDYHLLADYDISVRVLLNLLDNAMRHSPKDCTIEVGTEKLDGFLRIAVKDQGEGIPPDLLPFIFDKYTRGNHANHVDQRSYGLGLAFCKMAIEAHGGRIGAISEQGKGCEIWFTLPLASETLIETTSQPQTSLCADQQELPKLRQDELEYLNENYGPIMHLSIHQISDIKDLLNKQDENSSAGIDQWKKAVITSTNQYNSLLFNQLVKQITNTDV